MERPKFAQLKNIKETLALIMNLHLIQHTCSTYY